MIGCPDGVEPIGCPDGADGWCAAADLVASAQDGVERSEVAAHDVGVAAPSLEGRLVVAASGTVVAVVRKSASPQRRLGAAEPQPPQW